MDDFCYPKSVLVVGVSEEPTNLGRAIVSNLERFCFKGEIYLLGLKKGNFGDRPIYTNIEDIHNVPELVVILTPAKTIPKILEACGRKGIQRAIIESGGFGEYSEEGKEIETEISRISKKHGIRFLGPNCIGIINLENGLNTSFVAGNPEGIRKDSISFISQSGGLVNEMLKLLSSENLGFNKFISIGNKLNLTENDVLKYLLQDPKTSTIGLYLESISDGAQLIRLTESSEKPIIVFKGNVSSAGSDIARFHTASLAGDDQICSAGFAQGGVHRVYSLDELINHFKIFKLPPMSGTNLAILGQSGGGNVIAADAAIANGFTLPKFSKELLDRVGSRVRAGVIRFTNPLDLGDLFDLEFYKIIVEETLKGSQFHGVLARYYFREKEATREFIETMACYSQIYRKPVVLCLVASEKEWLQARNNVAYPLFHESRGALQALAASLSHTKTEKKASFIPPLIGKGLHFEPPVLGGLGEVFSFLRDRGLPVTEYFKVSDLRGVLSAAHMIGYPVALKAASSQILHKTEVGGVKTGIQNEQALQIAFEEMYRQLFRVLPENELTFLVQQMVPQGLEVILGGRRDKEFGPIVLFGLGGILVEVLRDVSFRVAPVSEDQAMQMINETKGSILLKGYRGRPLSDIEALSSTISTFSKILIDFPEINEVEINPLFVLPKGKGCIAVDSRLSMK